MQVQRKAEAHAQVGPWQQAGWHKMLPWQVEEAGGLDGAADRQDSWQYSHGRVLGGVAARPNGAATNGRGWSRARWLRGTDVAD